MKTFVQVKDKKVNLFNFIKIHITYIPVVFTLILETHVSILGDCDTKQRFPQYSVCDFNLFHCVNFGYMKGCVIYSIVYDNRDFELYHIDKE